MKGTKALFSSRSDEWETPQGIFDELDKEFHFTLDACATDQNRKCDRYFTIEQNGLQKSWGGETVFINPPYSKISEWVAKAHHEGTKDNTVVVMMIPARTDTRYFHDYIIHRSEIRFIEGRLHFNGSRYNAPFPSMVVIFRGARKRKKRWHTISN